MGRQLYGSIQDVVVPEMNLAQTTRKVLTMQWLEVKTPYQELKLSVK